MCGITVDAFQAAFVSHESPHCGYECMHVCMDRTKTLVKPYERNSKRCKASRLTAFIVIHVVLHRLHHAPTPMSVLLKLTWTVENFSRWHEGCPCHGLAFWKMDGIVTTSTRRLMTSEGNTFNAARSTLGCTEYKGTNSVQPPTVHTALLLAP